MSIVISSWITINKRGYEVYEVLSEGLRNQMNEWIKIHNLIQNILARLSLLWDLQDPVKDTDKILQLYALISHKIISVKFIKMML